MKKPVIGIVARPSVDEDVNVLTVIESYRMAIIKSGGIPISILPPQLVEYNLYKAKEITDMTLEEKEMLNEQISLCDGILMPGGTKRYEYDWYITNYCLENNIPVLGICLGMQLLATHINRDTLELIAEDNPHSKPEIDDAHMVRLNPNSKLFNIIGEEEFMVNSRHKYKVTETGKFTIVGYSPDGIIEAIEHKDKNFAIGVQWHPERLMDTMPSKRLFASFIEACRSYHGSKN